MQVYAIALNNQARKAPQLIKDNYPDHYKFDDNLYLVRAQNTDVTRVCQLLGILDLDNKEGREYGVVFRLAPHHAGYADSALWEWLDDAHKETT
jgi:hypothetical protein